jgi:hypothetical protein
MKGGKCDDKKVALKLINQYADQYKIIEEEKKSLLLEITDLKTNLKINKEIIQGFFKSEKDKTEIFTKGVKDEIILLNKRNDQLTKESSELRSRVMYYEKILNESIVQYRDSTETLKSKIFILENVIIKKENVIHVMSNKLNKMMEKDAFIEEEHHNSYEKETFV